MSKSKRTLCTHIHIDIYTYVTVKFCNLICTNIHNWHCFYRISVQTFSVPLLMGRKMFHFVLTIKLLVCTCIHMLFDLILFTSVHSAKSCNGSTVQYCSVKNSVHGIEVTCHVATHHKCVLAFTYMTYDM